MRKFYTTFLLSLAGLSGAWAQQDTIKVSTAKELSDALEKYADKSDAVIKLMADIDVAEYKDFKQVDFNASLTGYYEETDSVSGEKRVVYHVIKNLKTSLFDDMSGAKVSGITLLDGERGDQIYGGLNACFLCEDASDCDFTDIIIMNCHYKQSSFGGDWYANQTGLLTNTMDHCNVTDVAVLNGSIYSDGYEIGGITGVATNGCKFTNCMADAYSIFYTEKEPNAYIGGLVGTSENCKFEGCKNKSIVSASLMSDNLGGISGRSTKCEFNDCYNEGTVTQLPPQSYGAFRAEASLRYLAAMGVNEIAKAADFAFRVKFHEYQTNYIGKPIDVDINSTGPSPSEVASHQVDVYGYGAMAMCAVAVVMAVYQVAMAIYDSQAPDEVGGITSLSYACTFNRCTNAGLLVCRDAYCGGIVGYADTKDGQITKINNCLNTGYIQGGEQTGGIVGYLKDSHATNCLNVGSVDCLKGTCGPIYGDTNAEGATITNCFAMEYGSTFHWSQFDKGGIVIFGPEELVSGRAVYEINRIMGNDTFRQTVGEDRYPNFTGAVVKESDIRTGIDLTYHVKDAASFCAALMDPYATIELENDIDFQDNYFSVYRRSYKFHGTIDGKGHAIKNVKVDAEDNDTKGFDKDNERHAMIQFAEGATFKNLTLDHLNVKRGIMVAGLVGNSMNCTYEDIKLTNSIIYAHNSYVGGLVYDSDHDNFTRCSTDMFTRVSTHGLPAGDLYAYAGGLVGKARCGHFTDCINQGWVTGRLDMVGGIVSMDSFSIFTRCINTGFVHHASTDIKDDDELGGIVAKATNSLFYECINEGRLLCEDENGGGIVGIGKSVTIVNCLNTSKDLQFSRPTCGAIIGYAESSTVANCVSNADYPLIGTEKNMNPASGNNYRLEIGNHNIGTWEMGVSEKTLASGIVARWLNNGYENRNAGKEAWYQNLNSDGLGDMIPYPVNAGHAKVQITDLPHDVITSADQLAAFAKKVNNGDKYACAVLDADIDLSTIAWWTPIGNHNNRFSGIFDGQGHTISGMMVNGNSNDDGSGLFGVAYNGAEIRNVILAKGCQATNSGNGGAAGILGGVFIEGTWGNVVIENCGSYAKVAANRHAGGIFGHVNTNTEKGRNIKVMINNCFNMGDIYAYDSNSGLLCGYIKNSGYITNSWSGGSLQRMEGSKVYPYDSHDKELEYFAGYEKMLFISNCFAIDPSKSQIGPLSYQTGVQKLTSDDLTNGKLTYELNGHATDGNLGWYQKIGIDDRPMLSSRGNDIVYACLNEDNSEYYINDSIRDAFYFYGAIRVKKDGSLALLDGSSKSSITLDKEITVGRAELNRSFTANVPSTLMLPFSAEIGTENPVRLFTFDKMQSITDERGYEKDVVAVMKEVEDGKIDAYTPYLAMFDKNTDGMGFDNVTLKPAEKAVTQRGDWYFIGQSSYRTISIDDFFNEKAIYYGYTGMEYDGFKLGQFACLGERASIAPFRCYLLCTSQDITYLQVDVVTKKAPTRAMTDGDDDPEQKYTRENMPEQIQIVLKGANGETGIATFDDETGEFRFEGWYDLNGNRVEENYQGVRVGNGKKIIVK